ncbi:MAG: PHP domain-containing protein, partial [bacterium]|nr:PHP domain-containing protein [bacterium]
MKLQFAELCATSNFSFLQGSSHPEEMVNAATQLGYSAIALADSCTVSGIVRAQMAAKNLNIQFIPATRLTLLDNIPDRNNFLPEYLPYETLAEEDCQRLPFDIITIPTSSDDYSAMTSLLTMGKMRAAKGRCWITIEDLKFIGSRTHIIILARRDNPPLIKKFVQQMTHLFTASNLSLAIWPPSTFQDHSLMSTLTIIAKETKVQLLATNNPLYHIKNRKNLLDILTCTRHKVTLSDAGYLLQENSERYLRSKNELWRLFCKFPSALERSIEIAELAKNFSLADIRYEYPTEVCPDGQSPLEFLKLTTIKEASGRYPQGIPEKVCQLLEKEFLLIGQLNYAKYFLTVYHIVKFARSQGILCQGRGAAANSAVCYCLGITAVDPDKIDLLLERFISLERNEPPDIDIDFEHERREEVIQYIYNTFGRSRAALVCEVVTYRTKSAITDVGKAFSLSVETIQELIQENKTLTI